MMVDPEPLHLDTPVPIAFAPALSPRRVLLGGCKCGHEHAEHSWLVQGRDAVRYCKVCKLVCKRHRHGPFTSDDEEPASG